MLEKLWIARGGNGGAHREAARQVDLDAVSAVEGPGDVQAVEGEVGRAALVGGEDGGVEQRRVIASDFHDGVLEAVGEGEIILGGSRDSI